MELIYNPVGAGNKINITEDILYVQGMPFDFIPYNVDHITVVNSNSKYFNKMFFERNIIPCIAVKHGSVLYK